ncbi:GMC oxidoreductase [Lysobacter korlensis]|uniref:GMC oxidoreductase n=1 Tax=Lysobacter korlensis TaxID=553636 RepID=A0ABV6RX52_9GAMM
MSSNRSADVVIVGSGPAGSTFARVLVDEFPGLRIVMVEAGPSTGEPPGRHVNTISDLDLKAAAQRASEGPDPEHRSGPPTIGPGPARPGTFLVDRDGEMPAAAMSSNVGGMGAHWTCACPPPGDGERIDFLPRAEFDSLFAEASTLLGVTQTAFEDAPLGRELRAALGAHFDDGRAPDRKVQPMPLAVTVRPDGSRYWTGTDVILGEVASSPSFELLAETLATRILHDAGRATGVEVRSLRTGERSTITAGAVVVAADALRTPQLLFASGIRPAALGRHLNDHTQVIALARLDDRFIPTEARTRPKQAGGPLEGYSGVSWIPYDRNSFPFHGQIMQMGTSPIPLGDVEEPWPGSIVGIGLFATKHIREDDRVEFDPAETDGYGLPRIRLRYQLDEVDQQTIQDAISWADRIAHMIGSPLGGPPRLLPAGSSLHYMGTVRMGIADDGTSVCDPESRLWGLENVFVGGNGVLPAPTACNPTATSLALAIRAARALGRGLKDRSVDAA